MPRINIFDQTLKIITRNYAATLLKLAFPSVPIQLKGTIENVELILPVRPVDFVHRVEYDGQDHILHIEFQLEHEAGFPQRLCSYYGALTEQFNLPVLTIALYLRHRQAPIPNEYVVKLGEQVVNRFTYPVLKLWDYVDDIRSGWLREFAPLLVTLVQQPDEAILQEERALILAEADQQKRADLLALAISVAVRYFDKPFLWHFFRQELEQMKEATFIEDWLKESLEEGYNKGMQQGLQQGLQQGVVLQRKTILRILQTRFDLAPGSLLDLLTQQLELISDLPKLDYLAEQALQDFSLADFRANLTKLVESAG